MVVPTTLELNSLEAATGMQSQTNRNNKYKLIVHTQRVHSKCTFIAREINLKINEQLYCHSSTPAASWIYPSSRGKL